MTGSGSSLRKSLRALVRAWTLSMVDRISKLPWGQREVREKDMRDGGERTRPCLSLAWSFAHHCEPHRFYRGHRLWWKRAWNKRIGSVEEKDAPCLWVTLAIQSDTNKGTSTLSLLSMQRYDETYQDTNPRIIQYIQTSLGYTDLYQRQVQSLLLGCSVFFVSFSYLSFSTQFSFHFQFLSSCPSSVRVSIILS